MNIGMNNVKVGSAVKFRRGDGTVQTDTVRQLFTQTVLLEPMARNEEHPAAVLTGHSWCFLRDIVEVEGEE